MQPYGPTQQPQGYPGDIEAERKRLTTWEETIKKEAESLKKMKAEVDATKTAKQYSVEELDMRIAQLTKKDEELKKSVSEKESMLHKINEVETKEKKLKDLEAELMREKDEVYSLKLKKEQELKDLDRRIADMSEVEANLRKEIDLREKDMKMGASVSSTESQMKEKELSSKIDDFERQKKEYERMMKDLDERKKIVEERERSISKGEAPPSEELLILKKENELKTAKIKELLAKLGMMPGSGAIPSGGSTDAQVRERDEKIAAMQKEIDDLKVALQAAFSADEEDEEEAESRSETAPVGPAPAHGAPKPAVAPPPAGGMPAPGAPKKKKVVKKIVKMTPDGKRLVKRVVVPTGPGPQQPSGLRPMGPQQQMQGGYPPQGAYGPRPPPPKSGGLFAKKQKFYLCPSCNQQGVPEGYRMCSICGFRF